MATYTENTFNIMSLCAGDGTLCEAPIWSDLTTLNAAQWRGAVDCVIAGFPCQPWSAAGKKRASTTSGGSGTTFNESLPTANQESSCLKMSLGLYEVEVSATSYKDLPRSGSMRRGICFEHPTSEHHTKERGFSSSQFPTPRAGDFQSPCLHGDGGMDLRSMVASNWPTPKVATGDYSYSRGNHAKKVMNLQGAAKNWAPPRASDGEKCGPNQKFGAGGLPLAAQAANHSPANPSRQAQTIAKHGKKSRPRLNPLFVSWLMGLPLGWTRLEPLGMGASLFARRSHLSPCFGDLSATSELSTLPKSDPSASVGLAKEIREQEILQPDLRQPIKGNQPKQHSVQIQEVGTLRASSSNARGIGKATKIRRSCPPCEREQVGQQDREPGANNSIGTRPNSQPPTASNLENMQDLQREIQASSSKAKAGTILREEVRQCSCSDQPRQNVAFRSWRRSHSKLLQTALGKENNDQR